MAEMNSSAPPAALPISFLDVEDIHNLCRSQLDVLLAAYCANGDRPSSEAVAFLLMQIIKQTDTIYGEYEKLRQALRPLTDAVERQELLGRIGDQIGAMSPKETEFFDLCRSVPIEARPYVLASFEQISKIGKKLERTQKRLASVEGAKKSNGRRQPHHR